MPVVTFTADFDFYPPQLNGRWMRAYKQGMTALVTTPCAAAAIAAGKAAIARDNGEGNGQGIAAGQNGAHASGGALGN
jgi:hypothetical protein